MSAHLEDAYEVAQKWNSDDISRDSVILFFFHLRLHFDKISDPRPPILRTYLDWVQHTSLDAKQHTQLLGIMSARLTQLHAKFGMTARHGVYGTVFAEYVLGMRDLFAELRTIFSSYKPLPVFDQHDVRIFKSVAKNLFLFLTRKELRAGETLFTGAGLLHRRNLEKYSGGCCGLRRRGRRGARRPWCPWSRSSDDYLFSLMYDAIESDREEYPYRLVCDWSLYRKSSEKIVECRVNISPLDQDKSVLLKDFPYRPINFQISPIPNRPGGYPNLTLFGHVLPPEADS